MRTHFDVFGLPRSHAVDVPALEKQFRELSLQLHPDRVAQGNARERLQALEGTTALNEAYKTLKDPVRRAFYLLKLHGIDLDREDAGAQKDMPLAFLEEVMTLREELDDAIAAKDLPKAQAMAKDVAARKQAALAEAVSALQGLEGAGDSPDGVRKASHALGRVRYFTRFLEQVDAFEEEVLA
ncbi:Fe-S protein assembly co-chaperone HscB [Corallococcus praedator]|uniref:Co-chaperone protein HscB homolog n=1 Tax=Corallococcus praedator TaxID=2316724 RepID=A0ABX9Q6V8_9BACT|nr:MULTISPECIES: Fe-S protein assembly co-chaperone HscB [Corallococcus]RKH19394.1 Fe-S protein assembly co-chaperone HscB [Corallococcus sp. CA047B]RKH33321.1 Fe-S protein assembly co-chaperone HscB [Corallococcus sp. CA031C]RKH92826.1 Fe-S protein assembly co-chaperone HscB [Corallococcus praedator]